MPAAVDVEPDGSARDLSKDPLLDLESDLGWICLSDHNNLSDDETEIRSPPGSQQVTSNELDQPLDSGPQPMIEADSNNTGGNLEKLCTMLRRHELVFLKFSQESPQILANSLSAAKDLMQLTILVNKTNEDRAAEAKRQAEHDKNVMLILKKRLDETVAENFANINASMQNGTELYEQAALSAFQKSDIFKTGMEKVVAELQPRINRQAAMNGQAVIRAFEESGIFKTIVEKAVVKLQPHISHPVDNGNNAFDEDIQ
ncbi:hypothetical protein FVER53590_02924 [Fusarium verticillioides]|nr:hypothetical protein FVER53590_02924 [Fusarium verticillioides]